MPVVYPGGTYVFCEYVDLEDLSVLLSRSPSGILTTLKRHVETRPVRTLYRPGPSPLVASIPVYNIYDLKDLFHLPDDYVEELMSFRRRAGEKIVEIPVPVSVSS